MNRLPSVVRPIPLTKTRLLQQTPFADPCHAKPRVAAPCKPREPVAVVASECAKADELVNIPPGRQADNTANHWRRQTASRPLARRKVVDEIALTQMLVRSAVRA